MGAFSFKRRFVVPIARGLGVTYPVEFIESTLDRPKRQTIRKDRVDGRVCKPGEVIALYYAQRTKHCYLIGRGRCLRVDRIRIVVGSLTLWISLAGRAMGRRRMEPFARADGFENALDMHAFWLAEHGVGEFRGTVTYWEPL